MGSKSNVHVIEEGRGEVVAGIYCLRVDRVYYKGCHFFTIGGIQHALLADSSLCLHTDDV